LKLTKKPCQEQSRRNVSKRYSDAESLIRSMKMIKFIKKIKGEIFKKNISNDFIQWLRFANAGMLNSGNLYCMEHAIRNIPSENPVLEIGSFCGLSTNVIIYFLSKYKKKNPVFSCDKWIFENAEKGEYVGDSEILHDDYRDFVKATFIKNLEFFSGNRKPYTIETFSHEFFRLWSGKAAVKDVFGREVNLGGKISFCYIDGNHQYEFTRSDFEHTDYYLETGGFILFDDSYDGNRFDLSRLMKEIKKQKKYELVMKNPNYLFRKKW
jgi:hypothetical protein